MPWWGETVQAPIKQLARAVPVARMDLLDDKPLVQWKLHQPSIGFYMGQPVPRLEGAQEPPDGDWALTRLDRLNDDERQRFEIIRQARGYALVRPATAASEPLSAIGSAHLAAEAASAAAAAAQAASEAAALEASAPSRPGHGAHRANKGR
jgi:hypothetical protein